MSQPQILLVTPNTDEQWNEARVILREYAAQLGVDLCFQGFEQELAELPQHYREPAGVFLMALIDGAVAGCAGFRQLSDVDYPNACEMKRLFVRPAFRRFGLGRFLAQALLDRGLEAGYSTMLLDTLDDMEAARGLYESLGFEDVPPYYYNPIPGAHYLKCDLAAPRSSSSGCLR
jgi:putative acetyltransferase